MVDGQSQVGVMKGSVKQSVSTFVGVRNISQTAK